MPRYIAALASPLLAACLVATGCTSHAPVATNKDKTFSFDLTTEGIVASPDFISTGATAIFSAANGQASGEEQLRFTNRSNASIDIVREEISGSSFALKQPTKDIKLAPTNSTTIQLAFAPKTVGVSHAQLSMVEATGKTFTVNLNGLNAKGIESSNEPNLQEIFDTFGYKVNVAMPAHPPTNTGAASADIRNSISTSKDPVGDEVIAPTFAEADPQQPVQLVPLANYISRSKYTLGWFGINQAGSSSDTQPVLAFNGGTDNFGGQNQQLVPGLAADGFSALANGSSVSFHPRYTQFGFWDGQHHVFSEDSLNYNHEHQIRVYPARDVNGTPIPHAYLIAEDSIDSSTHYRNYDFQDFVFLIRNVDPSAVHP